MKAERYQQIEQVFHAALKRKPEERTAFIEQACGDDEQLRREVTSLIAYDDRAALFIEMPPADVAAALLAEGQEQSMLGRTLGHYQILSRLGAGGMGVIYLAEDTKLGRRVALKLLQPKSIVDERAGKRLVREAQAAAKLDHPNICAIHEVSEENDHLFIVMQYVEGEALSSRIQKGPLELTEILNVAVQVADALREAHSRGITHRDIKPQNIMITTSGQAKVLDFGLAKVVPEPASTASQAETNSLVTEPGLIIGTVPYMSPEQVKGQTIDARSDVFSLGAVLYEMVSGRQPFAAGSAAETISAILSEEPPSLAKCATNVPEELQRIVRKCLEKDKERRYQSTGDLLVDLRKLKNETDSGAISPAVSLRRTRYTEIYISVVLAILVLVAVYYLWPESTSTVSRGPASSTAINSTSPLRSIAVLPFKPLVADHRDEFMEMGMADTLIVRLSNLREVTVRPISSVRRFSGLEQDAVAAGRELGVESVLDGQIQQWGDRIRVTARLIDVGDGKQLWAGQFDERFTDIFKVQDLISEKVTSALALSLTGEEQRQLTKRYTENAEAYRLYVNGRFFWEKRTEDGLKKAIEYFQETIEEDPNYALAYVGLADSHLLLEEYAGTPSSETVPKARAAALRALQIDDSLAEAHASFGFIEMCSWNFSDAEREYRRAIELNPNYPTARHWYSIYLRETRGRFDEAMEEIKRARQLDPLSPVISANVALVHLAKGELDSAIEEFKKIIELEPNFPPGHCYLSLAYQRQRRYKQAIAGFRRAVELSGRASVYLSQLGQCYAVAGKRAEARVILKELEKKYAKGESNGLYLASVWAGLGEKDRAFAWLEKDFQARNGLLPRLSYSPIFVTLRDLLRSDPRWGDLLRRIGLAQN